MIYSHHSVYMKESNQPNVTRGRREFHPSTKMESPSTRTGYVRTGITAGSVNAAPVVTSKYAPCRGHMMRVPSSSP